MTRPTVTALEFFADLKWIDGRPLLDTIEPYRRRLFTQALDEHDDEGVPRYSMVLAGRGKKNGKSTDLVLGALYKLVICESVQGSDCLILANDESQAGDDLALAKKLIRPNPSLQGELEVLASEIRRRDGLGTLRIMSSRDAIGAHGRTATFIGYDEIHGLKSWDILEALAPDPTRHVLTWITSYDTIFNRTGVPLYDLKAMAKRGDDPRMLFSWYSSDFGTDPAFTELAEPELRANPSIASFAADYLATQKRRLPLHRYRRLHLNLPGAPEGAAFDADLVLAAVVSGRRQLEWREGVRYVAFVDMSGGSSDDAVLAIAHFDAASKRAVLDHIVSQTGGTPFNPRMAVRKFAEVVKSYGLTKVHGDAYAGHTFRQDFLEHQVVYEVSTRTAAELYDRFEPVLNAGACELVDAAKLTEQLLTLVVKGDKIVHQTGDHDDWANAAAGAIWYARPHAAMRITVIPDLSRTAIEAAGAYGSIGPDVQEEPLHVRVAQAQARARERVKNPAAFASPFSGGANALDGMSAPRFGGGYWGPSGGPGRRFDG